MLLMCPPERVLLEYLVLFEILSDPPPFIISQGQPIFLKERVDARNTSVPRVFEICQRQSSVLRDCLLPLECIFGPNSLRVDKLTLPSLDIPVQIRNELVLFVAHACPEVRNAGVCLLGEAQVSLGNKYVTHAEHAKASQLLRGVEDYGRETTGHLTVQTDLDACLNLIFALHKQIEQLLGVDDCFAEISHQADESGVPLVGDLGESSGTTSHQNLPHPILEPLDPFFVDLDESLGRDLLRVLILQFPDAILLREFLHRASYLRQNAHFEA